MRRFGFLFACLMSLACAVSCSSSPPLTLQLRGSSSVTPLAMRLASQYMTEHPGAAITVMQTDSGDGVMAIGTGMTDLGMASRPLSATELMTYPGLVPTEIARDAIAVVVHPGNGVASLTLTQTAAIFAGTTTDWSAVGGTPGPIHVYVREVGSGTRDFFVGVVLGTTPLAASATVGMGNPGVLAEVAADPSGIGFMSFGSVDATVVPISLDASGGAGPIAPSHDTVRAQTYPITRPLLLVKPVHPTMAADIFVDYCLTPASQDIANTLGFVSVI